MLRGLADKIFQHNMVRSFHRGLIDNYIDEFIRVYEDYRANCALILGHNMDKNRGVLRSLLREVCRERRIPLLIMDFDTFDPRTVSEGTILHNIEQFFTTVVLR
jgi:hypothetical protein